MSTFEEFPKIPRLKRSVTITEKIDGTNAQVCITPEPQLEHVIAVQDDDQGRRLYMHAGSRNRYLGIHNDNFGFANWVALNAEELFKLGEGRHFGEWWGQGIQRRYGLEEKRFSLFNTSLWTPENHTRPACCHVVPVIYTGDLSSVDNAIELLRNGGSFAAPGWMKPEGVVVFHSASRSRYKVLCENDDVPKSAAA